MIDATPSFATATSRLSTLDNVASPPVEHRGNPDMASPINFNQFLEKEKLKSNGSNFTDWFRHVRIFLNGGNLQYVLDAPLGDPPAETETDEVKNEKGHWKRNCSKYLADLKSGLVKKKKEEMRNTFTIDTAGNTTTKRSEGKIFVAKNGTFLEKEFLTKEVTGRKVELDEIEESLLVDQSSAVPENVPVPPTPATEEANDNDHETSNETATEPRRSTRDRLIVSWASSKQCTVAKSSESEYIAAEASSEAVWMKRFIVELGVVPSALDPLVISCDNMGAIANAQEPRSHKRLKHIKLRYHSIREYIEDGEVKICKVHTI
ncbi:hypothetical protein QYE76_028536 [Lolium multiflorum]|uniref:Uncharacterized protein n=1 Tax=Lolium multiflorum TaxID=4521 RepID=A0AAD8VH96_LOLMU|nr:hypothetical protein QYE76_028536 [Lolium multiflorum]